MMEFIKFLFSFLIIIQIVGWFNPQFFIRCGNESNKTRVNILLLYGLCAFILSSFYKSLLFSLLYAILWIIFLSYGLFLQYCYKGSDLIFFIKNIVNNLKTKEFNLQNNNINSEELYNYDKDKKINREHIPLKVQHQVWRRDQGRCVYCGSQENLEFDHKIPVSKGGSNTARNIQLLCAKCNRKKCDKI